MSWSACSPVLTDTTAMSNYSVCDMHILKEVGGRPSKLSLSFGTRHIAQLLECEVLRLSPALIRLGVVVVQVCDPGTQDREARM